MLLLFVILDKVQVIGIQGNIYPSWKRTSNLVEEKLLCNNKISLEDLLQKQSPKNIPWFKTWIHEEATKITIGINGSILMDPLIVKIFKLIDSGGKWEMEKTT